MIKLSETKELLNIVPKKNKDFLAAGNFQIFVVVFFFKLFIVCLFTKEKTRKKRLVQLILLMTGIFLHRE